LTQQNPKVNLKNTRTHTTQPKKKKKRKELPKMASELDQFADLELSKEDREQIFDPPLDRQQLEGAGTSRYVPRIKLYPFLEQIRKTDRTRPFSLSRTDIPQPENIPPTPTNIPTIFH